MSPHASTRSHSPVEFNELIAILAQVKLSPTKARALSATLNMMADAIEEDESPANGSLPPPAATPVNSPVLFQSQHPSSDYGSVSSGGTIASFSPTSAIEARLSDPSNTDSGYWSQASLPPTSPPPMSPPSHALSPPSPPKSPISFALSRKEKHERWGAAFNAMKMRQREQHFNENQPVVLRAAVPQASNNSTHLDNTARSSAQLPDFGLASPSLSGSSTKYPASPEGAYFRVFKLPSRSPLTFYVAPAHPKASLYVVTRGKEVGIFSGWYVYFPRSLVFAHRFLRTRVLPLINRVQGASHMKISSIEQGEQIMWEEYARGTCLVI
ncbi:hypothetical protein EYR40_008377 [Pleurotus pulmonarius]|nr:hypothetical protein EYR40_008377 [Pleurotus pulmonarius]